MPDETFRPQKRDTPVDDIQDAATNQAKLEQMTQIRNQAQAETERGPDQPKLPPGLDIKGNPPPEFLEARKQAQQQSQQRQGPPPPRGTTPGEQAQQQSQQRQGPPPPRGTTPGDLASVLEQIRGSKKSHDTIKLPSMGKFYNDGPTNGVIHMRAMTGHEEEILATPRFVKNGQAINMIFKRCMQEQFDCENFLSQDRTYMLIYLRGISYSPEYEVELKCPECDTKFATVIDLNSLFVDYCPDDFTPDNLSGVLPSTGLEFTYRLPSGNDERAITEYRERRMKNFDLAGQADDTLLYRTATLLTTIGGKPTTDTNPVLQILRELPIQDVAHLRNTLTDPPFGVDTNVGISCMACLADFDVDLPLEANFFFPRGKKQTHR